MHSNPIANGLLSGAVAAVVAAILHIAFLQPILLRAEEYQTGARVLSVVAAGGSLDVNATADGVPAAELGTFPTRFDAAIDPARDAQTVGFFLLTYAAYGLLLAAIVDIARRRGYVPEAGHAALWGAAGFAAFALVPSFGMAPEPPGLAAGDLVMRQVWWIGCSAITLATIASAVIARPSGLWIGLGSAALATMMLIAPVPKVLTGTVPPELTGIFATRAIGIAAAAWLSLSYCILRQPRLVAPPVHAP